MSNNVTTGHAVVAAAALAFATWGGGASISRVAAQSAPADRPVTLDIDYAGPESVGASTTAAQPTRPAARAGRSPRRDPAVSAPASEPITEAATAAPQPSAPTASPPADTSLAVDAAGYAGPRMARGTHRLQAPFPEHNVVVCLAGCPMGKEAIVFFEKRVGNRAPSYGRLGSARVITVGMAGDGVRATTAAMAEAPSAPQAVGGVTCLAGCYSTPKTYTGRRGVEIAPVAPSGRVLEGSWMTVTSADGPTPAAGVEVGVTKRGKQKAVRRNDSLGSDWFTRRF